MPNAHTHTNTQKEMMMWSIAHTQRKPTRNLHTFRVAADTEAHNILDFLWICRPTANGKCRHFSVEPPLPALVARCAMLRHMPRLTNYINAPADTHTHTLYGADRRTVICAATLAQVEYRRCSAAASVICLSAWITVQHDLPVFWKWSHENPEYRLTSRESRIEYVSQYNFHCHSFASRMYIYVGPLIY